MNNLVKVSDLFNVIYGVNLELVNLTQCKSTGKNAVPFVSRTENNNGVSAFVEMELDIEPNPAHTLSVAGGGSVLSTFYQVFPYYSGRDLYVLVPKRKMSIIEMLFYAKCISANKYKYNYGRQANKTLKNILIPSQIPAELENKLTAYHKELEKEISKKSLIDKKLKLEIDKWEYFNITDIFDLEKCKCSNATELLEEGNDVYYTGAKKDNNGVMRKVEFNEYLVSKGNCIVFIGDGQGSIGYSLYQPRDFIGSTTLTCGYNKNLNSYIGMFLVTVLDQERFKYSFGRKYGKTQLQKSKIKLPAKNKNPDWNFMENYIRSLSYSSSL